MKLRVFPSQKGDSLLLTSDDGKHILIDGGMKASYIKYVEPALQRIRAAGGVLDVVYVSHIDEDHIAGVLQLLDDTMAWRVYRYQQRNGSKASQPPRGEPPEIKNVWHNAFTDVIKDNAGSIQQMLAATATALSASTDPERLTWADTNRNLAQSVSQAIGVSRRIATDQLNLPLNKQFGGKLALVRGKEVVKIGNLEFRVIGPFKVDLEKLLEEWNNWLRAHQEAVRKLRRKAIADGRSVGNTFAELLDPLALQAEALGDRNKVTPPNLASLMFHVSDGAASMLLTGDGHSKDILAGLKHHGLLNTKGVTHFNLLKVQHHGSEFNIDKEFCSLVTADHYVFCGNGEHQNPDPRVVELLVKSRLGMSDKRVFKVWFNCASTVVGKRENQAHMKGLEALMAELSAPTNGRVQSYFLDGPELELEL